MTMDASIILAGRPVNALAALDAGTTAAGNALQVGHQADLMNVFQEHGPGIAAGNQNALNALSRLDPMASLGVQESRLGMDATRQQMRISEERLQLARQAGARAAASHVRGLSAEQAAAERAQIAQGLATAIPALREGNLDAVNQVLRTAGLEPTGSLDDAALTIAQYEGALEQYQNAQAIMGQPPQPDYRFDDGMFFDANNPQAGAQPIPGMDQGDPGFRRATPEEAANYGAEAGQFGPNGRFYPINPPEGLELITTPGGGTTLRQGAGIGGNDLPQPRPIMDGTTTALQDVGRVMELIDQNPVLTTGLVGNMFSGLPGSEAYDVAQLLQTIRANMTFETLNQLRANSSNGASGLGQVTNVEIGLLGAALGSIEQAQSEEQLVENLMRLQRQMNAIVYGDPAGEDAAARRMQQGLPLYGQEVNGMIYVGGDPNSERSWRRAQ